MIDFLLSLFNQGNALIEEKDGIFYIEFKVSGIKKKCVIQLIKHEIKQEKESKNGIETRINKLEKNYKDLLNKFEELKSVRTKEISNFVIEIFNKEIKSNLLQEVKQMISSEFNLNNISKNKSEDKNIEKNIENNIMKKVSEVVNNNENKINNQINIIQKQLNENINCLKDIKSNISNNFILLEVKIDEKDLNKDVYLLNQRRTYKYYCNFERDDIEIIIDNQIVNIKHREEEFKYDKNSKNCELSQEIEHKINPEYSYYWNFTTTGIHSVKIIFKKKLLHCYYLFAYCKNIYKADCSNFYCSQINNCSQMFQNCSSIIEINFGKLDFALSTNFSDMFEGCENLEKLDVSFFNTNNSKSFSYMFSDCSKLKEINISKFKTSNCEYIKYMFSRCSSLESIDMLNWDMRNINYIDYLFSGCSKLKKIKMNFNNYKKLEFKDTFKGLPDGGSFVWKNGIYCNELLKELPVSWNRTQE